MRIIALMNQKGGVGKTTTTVNLGAALARRGRSVCLVDLDPQAHLTLNFGLETGAPTPGLYDVLVEERGLLEVMHRLEPTVAIVPSGIDLAGAEIDLVGREGRETLLRRRIEATQHDFDYMLLDCPPSLGLLTVNALAAADEVLIPMQPQFLALQGMARLLETVQLVSQSVNPRLRVAGVVLTMFDPTARLTGEVVAELQRFIDEGRGGSTPWSTARLYATRIRRNIKLAECPGFGQTIFAYEPSSHGAADYAALADELLAAEPPRVRVEIARAARAGEGSRDGAAA